MGLTGASTLVRSVIKNFKYPGTDSGPTALTTRIEVRWRDLHRGRRLGRAEPSGHGQARAARYHLTGFRSDPDHDAGGCGAERDQPVQIVGALVRGGLGGAVGTTAAVTAALSRGAAGLSGGRRRLERQAKR
jgi:hypothetical protein